MFDITQMNASRSTPASTGSGKFGSQREIPSPDEASLPIAAGNPKPIVTWRVTRSGNPKGLTTLHASRPGRRESELSTAEGGALISDLAMLGVPRLVFAGGEPLLRADLVELVAYARKLGIQPALSTHGALLSPALALRLKCAGLHGVSLLQGPGSTLDHYGARDEFKFVLKAYENCEAAGLATEIRVPLNRGNYPHLGGILDLVERLRIRKVVFTHLVYTGPGNQLPHDLTHEEKRSALDLLLDRAEDFQCRGVEINIATDENHVDGIYHYLRLARNNPVRAAAAFPLLQGCGADFKGAGVGIAGVDFAGGVHPDSYWVSCNLGNVRETPFSEIWEKSPDSLLRGLRDRLPLLKGRCGNCRWKQTCGGNLRVRANEYFGDPWMSDPACYLTNSEIVKKVTEPAEVMEDDVLLEEQAA